MRFGDEETDDRCRRSSIRSHARPTCRRSRTWRARWIHALDLDIALPMHGPVIAHDIPRVLAGALAHREAAPRKPRRRSSGGATAGAGQAPATMNSSAALR
ncbi:hypothetical protein [Burkholderia cenocepacia]|uniref:hypothetical protein n=1 Tax=Burkholderia cenocepacia TaxID=95486 RepID=UPI00073AA500|nr:hypothetical protein [Burkholderia cenocepacia]ALV60414.1 hypothetical protein TQ36_30405 [Burkholderia cenocepacia]MDN7540463.1 hypothetical protein [Burkholderia cenocepacia]